MYILLVRTRMLCYLCFTYCNALKLKPVLSVSYEIPFHTVLYENTPIFGLPAQCNL